MTLVTAVDYEIDEFEQLANKAKTLLENSQSENTRVSYRSDWKHFTEWCASKHLNSLPAAIHTIIAYLVDHCEKFKISTLERRLVTIRQAHKTAGCPLDRNDVLIPKTMKGIRNTYGVPQNAKSPIMLEDLKGMIGELDDRLIGIRDKAILLIGFTGAFRRSELVHLMVEDLAFTKQGLQVMIRRSKTDQSGRGCIIPIPYGSNPETCPVRAVIDWLDSAGIEQGPLFRAINRHGQISPCALCSASITLIVKRNEHLRGKEKQFSGHSLRAGFCTEAAQSMQS